MPVIDIVLIAVIALMGGSYAFRGWKRSRSPSSSVEGYGKAMEALGDLSKKRPAIAVKVGEGARSSTAGPDPDDLGGDGDDGAEGIVTPVPTPKPLRPARAPSQPRPSLRIRGDDQSGTSPPLPSLPRAADRRKPVSRSVEERAPIVARPGGAGGPQDPAARKAPRSGRHLRRAPRGETRVSKRPVHQGRGRGARLAAEARTVDGVPRKPSSGEVRGGEGTAEGPGALGPSRSAAKRRSAGSKRDPVLLAGVGAVAVSLVAVGTAAVVSTYSTGSANGSGNANGSGSAKGVGHGHRKGKSPSRPAASPRPPSPLPVALSPVSVSQGLAVYNVPLRSYYVTVVTSGPCWVEEQSGPNTTVLWQRVMQAGNRRTMQITGTLWLRLGNPPLAAVTLNGRPLSFPSAGGVPVDLYLKGIRPPGAYGGGQP